MTVEIAVRHRLGQFQLDASFAAESGLTALFGRSGSGKTSLVNVVAGLIRPDSGRIVVSGERLLDTAAGVSVPPHRRRVGYIFQEGRLFPHLTVRQNLLYGRWFSRVGAGGLALGEVVDLLGVSHLLERRPGRLSGGEKQRIAIGRAFLAEPRILLMDEPLASLDEARKSEILPYIERLRDNVRIPIVYVSHSIAEVARLATTVVVMSEGRIAAAGPTAEVMARVDLFPLTGRAEAGAIVETRVHEHDIAYGLTVLRTAAGDLRVPHVEAALGTPLRVRIRARDVMIGLKPPEDLSALNVLPGRIVEIGPQHDGAIVEVRLDCGGEALLARLTRKSVERLSLTPGREVFAVIKTIAFDRHSVGGSLPHASGSDAAAV